MNAWNIDANSISTGEIGSDVTSLMVTTREIRDFLSPNTKKMFIVAPKGIGKTFLLKVKSQLFRDTGSGYKFIPEETLCESFTSNDLSFSENDLLRFSERAIWNKTWELCLYTLVLKHFKSKEIPGEIIRIVGEDTGVLNEILGAFLQVRSNIEKLHALVAIKLKPAVRRLRENSSVNQIAVFIDNIDESFDSYVGFTAKSEGKLKASSIWINAQLSLLNVARDICLSNHHIKIFATIRSEAYNNFFDPLKLQIDELCVFLKYTKEELKEIFHKNIRLTPPEDLVSRGNPDPLIDLFGYHEIPHKFIEDEKGNKRKENLFDFIYRHTYARPRDIVLMGKSIVEKVPPQRRKNTSEVGAIINEQSYRLFDQLKNETIPVFEEEIFEAFCLRVKANVIRYDEAYKIFQHFKEEGFTNVFSYFYRLGLIGIVECDLSGNGGVLKQSFLPVGQYSLTEESIPEFQYFVLHPSLNKKMKQIYDVGFYDRFNIIGYDYPFSVNKIKLVENHFHFGLDRDSVTTIIPTIQSSKCLAVLVLPSAEWAELEFSKTMVLQVNGQDISFRVYRKNLNEEEKNEIKSDWKGKKYHVLIYSDFIEDISFFFEKCASTSFCLFFPNADLMKSLLRNTDIDSHLSVYYFSREYSKADYDFFSGYIKEANTSAATELVLMDRFQLSADKQHNMDDEILRCSVAAETSFNIIYKSRPNSIFKSSDKFTKAHSDNEMAFYKNRQNYLIEGTYHLFKVLASKGILEEKACHYLIEKFISLQSNRVLSFYNDKEINNLFNGRNREVVKKELVQFGMEVADRMEKLYREGVLVATGHHLEESKEKLYFPSEEEFYANIKSIPGFYNCSEAFLELKNILEYLYLSNYRKVFVSYSSKDSGIIKKVFARLSLLGIEASIFEHDNTFLPNKTYMQSVVKNHDRMIFFASENSLASDACHFELSECIEYMRNKNDSNKLIVICLDDYVTNACPDAFFDPQRRNNLLFLRTHTSLMNKYEPVYSNNLRKMDEWLSEIAKKSLLLP